MRRALVLVAVMLVIPAVAWAAFGEPEVADPTFFVSDSIPDQLQVDAAGRAYFVSLERVTVGDPDDGDTDTQVVVYERCGTDWQVDSRHGQLPDDLSFETRPISLEVAANGDMLVVWLDGSEAERKIGTSFRPAGGDWGAPQAIDAPNVTGVLSDIAPNGDAVLAYQENAVDAPLQVAVRTKASGVWAQDELGAVEGLRAVAMSPSADAIVLTSDQGLPTTLQTWFRPAGGTWGGEQAMPDDVLSTVVPTAIAFAPNGKAVLGVGVPAQGITNQRVMWAQRGAGAAGTWSGLTELSEIDNSAGGIGRLHAVTHPGGVVLGWTERQTGAFLDDVGVARFNGTTFEPRKLYSVDNQFVSVSVGATPSGRTIVAAAHQTPTPARRRILVAEAQGIAGPWPATMDEVSKPPSGDYRDPRVGAGGIVAVAYGVHAGNDSRSEVVADGPSPACSAATPTPTPTATATASPNPNPNPSPNPQPQPPPPPGPGQDVTAPKGKLQKVAFKGGKIRITMRLDEAATVTFKVDGKALAKKKLKAGTRKLALKPKKKLKRGRHTLTADARDTAGNRAKTLKKRFKVG